MKLEISVKFIDENGMEATKPVTVDTSVPDFDDFHERGGVHVCTLPNRHLNPVSKIK